MLMSNLILFPRSNVNAVNYFVQQDTSNSSKKYFHKVTASTQKVYYAESIPS